MCFVQGGPDKDFVREELMSILEDPQVTPKWVSKWKELRIIFVSLLAYKNHILVSSLPVMQWIFTLWPSKTSLGLMQGKCTEHWNMKKQPGDLSEILVVVKTLGIKIDGCIDGGYNR